MKKIFTVLFLNLLRSTKHPKIITAGVITLLLLVGSLLALRLEQSPLASGAQQANAIAGGNAATNAVNANPATGQPAKPAKPQAKSKKSSNPPPSKAQSAPTTDNTKPSNPAELKIKDVALDQPTPTCSNQQPAYAVQTAHLSMTSSFYSGGTVRWYWETRVDGAESTDNPPISNQTYTKDVAAGSAPIDLTSVNGTDPLLTAPTSSTYSYRFRLHVVSPNDVTSDWVSVPVVLDNSCQPAH